MATLLRGKGLWAYSHGDQDDLAARLDRALDLAPQMGATHILFKVAQGANYYSERASVAVGRIRDAGLIPFAWMWLALTDPDGEAQVVQRAFADGYAGFVFDMEEHTTNPDLSCVGKYAQAEQLGETLGQAGIDSNTLYLCSFPNIYHHRTLPYDQMAVFCRGGTMPMAYGTFLAGGYTVEQVLDEWTYGHHQRWCDERSDDLPVYPVLAPYLNEAGTDRMGPDDFRPWLERLAGHSPSFLSIYTARAVDPSVLPLVRDFELAEVEEESLLRRIVAGLPNIVRELFGGGGGQPAETLPQVVVESPEVGFVRLRAEATTASEEQAQIPHGDTLYSLEGAATEGKVGVLHQWLRVQTAAGARGYVAAWYLRMPGEPPLESLPKVVVESPEVGFVRLREEATTASQELAQIPHGDTLYSLEGAATEGKVGVLHQWLRVRTAAGLPGYVAAWYLRLPGEAPVEPPEVDNRQPVSDADVPIGQSAWIYGMHMTTVHEEPGYRVEVRDLFQGTGRRGWVFFTEEVGLDQLQPNDVRKGNLWDWAQAANYGVIVRLNHRYEPGGTLPVSQHYQAFANTCGEYARHYLQHPEAAGQYTWTVVIANEQNNPREWPGGPAQPDEIITPALYAQAFNLAYQRIKSVMGDSAMVVPGAIDPYNYDARLGLKPLQYFEQMLDGITALDGIALHAYTHGMDVAAITHELKFGNAPLTDHYYDFRTYRAFMQRIPSRWSNVPVYITETNPLFKTAEPDWGWRDENVGWIQAAYADINAWNATAHVQQIRALLLYRWAGDQWIMKGKGNLVTDFRQSMTHDYRWRA